MVEVDAPPALTAVRQPPDIHDLISRYEAEKQRTARLALVARLGQRMAARLEPEDLFATTVAELHHRLGYDHVSLFLLKDDDPATLVHRACASRWPDSHPVSYQQPTSEGILGAAVRQQEPQLINNTQDALDPLLDAGQTVAINDVHIDPRVSAELRQIQKESGRPALALIPLIARRRRIGLVVLSYTAVYAWQAEDLRPYQATAVQLAGVIDSRRQQRLLQERSQQVAVLEERQRLARELHDSVTQLIFSVTLLAQSIAPAWRRDPAEGEGRIRRLLELSQSALAEMRALLTELHPSAEQPLPIRSAPELQQLVPEKLLPALRHYAAEISSDSLQIRLSEIGPPSPKPANQLSPSLVVTLYRIAQEALNNVVKHAQAGEVAITLHQDQKTVRLTITDDGCGFLLPNGRLPGHLGLETMRDRAEAAGGVLQVSSRPGKGTAVTVTIPIQSYKVRGMRY